MLFRSSSGDAFRAIISDFKLLSDLSPEEKRSASVDSLILTLGIMINLVEWSDRANEQTRVLDNRSLGDAVQIFMVNLEKASEVRLDVSPLYDLPR